MTTHRASLLRTGTSVTAALASKTADDSNPTFAEILELVPTFDRLSPQVRSNLASGIRTFCRVMDRQPTQIPVVTERIRTMFRDALPAVAGVSPSRWRNVKSDVIRAIGLSGLGIEPRGEDVPLSDAWKVVIDGGSTSTHRFALRRFARYCCAHQIEPKAVDDATVAEFSSYLEDNLLSKTPHRIVGDLIRFWEPLRGASEGQCLHTANSAEPKPQVCDRLERRSSVPCARC